MNLLFNKRDNQKNEVFPYRERYLEHILKKGETVEKYETMLGELYIDKLFQDAAKDLEEDLLDHEKINPRRKKLQEFLEKGKNYNASELRKKVANSWMGEEEIILLVKEKKFEQAIEIFVNSEKYLEAELFC